MPDRHIVTSFDEDLQDIQNALLALGGRVEEAITLAARALDQRDEDLARQVIDGDKIVDDMEEAINQKVVLLLALRQPQAQDLRAVIAVMKMAADLERLGDYAKNMAKRVSALTIAQQIPGASAAIRRQARQVGQMLKDMLDAYARHDAPQALDVIERDVEVDEMTNALFREFITHMMEDPRNITPCLHYTFIAKNVERMGDLVTGAAEQVVFLITGVRPGDRVKGTSTAVIGAEDRKEA
jgi:phosphate transport system protein